MMPTIYAQRGDEVDEGLDNGPGMRSAAPTTVQLRRIERALNVLLTPLDPMHWELWRDEAHRALSALFSDAYPDVLMSVASEDAHRGIYQEFVSPLAAELHRHAGRRDWAAALEVDPARATLVRMVVPALRAALGAWSQLQLRRTELGRMLDTTGGYALLFNVRGTVLHENASFAELVAGEQPTDAARLRERARVMACTAGALRRGTNDRASMRTTTVRTANAEYELTATRSNALLGSEPVICVAFKRRVAAPLSNDDLRAKYGLTSRECEVARLVGLGLSNQEMADRLSVSFFTARNHVERVLGKLGVGNRARVGTLLRNEAA